MCFVNAIDTIGEYCNHLYASVNIPAGYSRMHMDSPPA